MRTASCPRGCDLLDKEVRLAGAPTIRVLRRIGDREGIMHMDPLYGRFGDRATFIHVEPYSLADLRSGFIQTPEPVTRAVASR